jgi:hypothetical protein
MKEIKVVFLDIDDVIQPFTPRKFAHLREMDKVFAELTQQHGIDYSQYGIIDVEAVCFEWDKEALAELKRILDTTGAKIVISSDWREHETSVTRMVDFFRIHGMEEYVIDYTPVENLGELKKQCKEYQKLEHYRSVEILEYLKRHPEVKKWVAIDDLRMDVDLGKNIVVTKYKMTQQDADKCIKILMSE